MSSEWYEATNIVKDRKREEFKRRQPEYFKHILYLSSGSILLTFNILSNAITGDHAFVHLSFLFCSSSGFLLSIISVILLIYTDYIRSYVEKEIVENLSPEDIKSIYESSDKDETLKSRVTEADKRANKIIYSIFRKNKVLILSRRPAYILTTTTLSGFLIGVLFLLVFIVLQF